MKLNLSSSRSSRSQHLIRAGVFLLITLTVMLHYLSSLPSVRGVSSSIVISQVYGGGGNSGATFKNDFIELFNRGNTTINVTGWTVQYASTTGTTWQSTTLSGSIAPGRYYLVQEAAGTGGTVSLPTPDASGSIAMSATGGKVALVSNPTLLSGACPASATIVDFVGYDGANCFEGSPTPTLSNTTAALRNNSGCADTDNNLADFTVGAPNPRNSASSASSCGTSTNPSGAGAASPGSVVAGGSTLLTVTVTPGTNPSSTGISVTGDLSQIGGPATQQFFDDGTHGDVTSGDNVFSFQAAVAGGTSAGAKTLPATITDAQARTGSTTISLTVTSPSTNPSGSGAASPNMLVAGGSTLLTVNVTPGTNPASTGIAVTGNLTSIGGSASQQFFDNGTNGDVTAGDNVFSFQATVAAGTTPGAKTLPITITDAQARTGSTTISLTVQSPPPPTTIKISQVYGGGGNSGTTYTNDFIEIFNSGATPIDVTGWSVQYASATASSWSVTPLCLTSSCVVMPGHYLLVQESQGTGGTTGLPAPDATGAIAMSATNGKVALVNSTVALSGTCPTGGGIADLVGYGTANCSETSPVSGLSNTTAAVRRGNGCIDTDNNASDFVKIGPIPRNSASPANSCGGDPAQPSGLGLASPSTLDPASATLLTVIVTTASAPPSTGLAVTADLTSIGGPAAQQFYDDGTHGDATAGDNVFSLQTTVGAHITTGVKSIVATITDAQSRTATAPITLTVESPTCGVERWSVKTGTDPDAAQVNLNNPTAATIADLIALPAPAVPPDNARVAPAETTVFVVNATLTLYKKEDDVDYHIVLKDESGNTMITEIPCPCCVGATSPFAAGIAQARATFDAHLTATTFFQTADVPVRVTGVGFFDFIHGQTGVAPNGIELHPVLDIVFLASTTTTLASSASSSTYGDPVTFTATVNGGAAGTPTGTVTFMEGTNTLGTGTLDGSGQAAFTTHTLPAGTHSITATYGGDGTFAASASGALSLPVSRATPAITWVNPADIVYGTALGAAQLNATTAVPGTFTYNPMAGIVFNAGNNQTLSVSFTPADTANYTTATRTVAINVLKAAPVITWGNPADIVYGTALSGTQLNATASVPGSFTYSPAAGTILNAGGGQVLSASFMPADTANYNAASASVVINVLRAMPTITWDNPADLECGTALSGAQLNATASVPGTFTYAPPAGTALNAGSNQTLSVTFTPADPANYNIATATRTVNVVDTTPPVPDLASLPAVTGECSATISAAPTATDKCAGRITGTTSDPLTWTTQGVFTVHWSYSDGHGNVSTQTQQVIVQDVTPPAVTPPPAVTAYTGPGATGCGVVISDAALGTATASDNCAGVTVTRSGVPAGNLFPVGTTTLTWTATDAGGNQKSVTQGVTVIDNTPPTISCPASITAAAAPGVCSAVVNYTVTAADNCPGVSVVSNPPSGSAFPVGTTTVNVVAKDAAGNPAGCTFNVTVTNPAPAATITGPSSGAVYAVNTPVNFTGMFTDAGGGTHAANWTFDNIAQAGTVNEATGAVSATQTFDTAGVYLVTLTVSDSCGGSGTANTVGGLTAMVVIYDPDGGYVTGGGWINSPAGAYAANPALTGRASFGFVSKYERGANVPTGRTEFQFQAAGFNFHSTSYDWLVVAGARAQYKGTGTVNGSGNYGFMLTAIDGQINGGGGADRFRIRIWDKYNGDTIVYDNQINDPDSADPTTVLGGGSIVIHK
ncbi:MAG TPA: lamin tail domain-containing protein [Blastocatellia bacterium]|nr:lamin tail domain-containing protein [Blastocatellia bacterium]